MLFRLLLAAALLAAAPARAQTKITQMPDAATPLAGSELVPIIQSGTNKKVTVANLRTQTYVLPLTFSGATSGGVPCFTSSSALTTSAALAANALLLGGGAGACPTSTTTGTGVVAALGVNIGSPGAVLVNGGAIAPVYTVGTLPTAGTAGRFARVTDGDAALAWGATVINSGAGATPYLVWDNGAAWTVAGK